MSRVIETSRLEERILGYSLLRNLKPELRQRVREKIHNRSLNALRRIDKALERKHKTGSA